MATQASLTPASSSVLCSRLVCRWRSPISDRRYRVRSRSSRISRGGTKLPRSRPCSSSWHSHWASVMSVLRPGRFLTCLRVAQQQLEIILQHVVHGLPVHAGGLHRHVRDAHLLEPVAQGQQLGGHRRVPVTREEKHSTPSLLRGWLPIARSRIRPPSPSSSGGASAVGPPTQPARGWCCGPTPSQPLPHRCRSRLRGGDRGRRQAGRDARGSCLRGAPFMTMASSGWPSGTCATRSTCCGTRSGRAPRLSG